jgi:hypothetical protein
MKIRTNMKNNLDTRKKYMRNYSTLIIDLADIAINIRMRKMIL